MKIPEKIKIGGHTVEIVSNEWAYNRMGSSHIIPNKIYVNSSICKSQQESTLLHEILEFINDSCSLQLSHLQISVLENMLYQVFVDNELCFKEEG